MKMSSLPTWMRAAVVVRSKGSFKFKITHVQRPEPGPTDVLVRLSVSGVCGTDMGLATGELGPTRDILGHEGVGYVVQLGRAVPSAQVKVGDRIGIAWLRDVCDVCEFCLHAGGETRCKEQLNSGRKRDGTFAEYALVPSRYLLRIPTHITVPDELIAPILCGGVTAYAAIKNAGIVGGKWVAVSGAGGGVGALAVQYAKAMGYRVLGIDVGAAKRDMCLSSGADCFVDAAQSQDLRRDAEVAMGQTGADLVLVCAASGGAYNAALGIVAAFGTLVSVGIPSPDQLVSFHPLLLIDMGIKIVGSAVGTKEDTLEAIGFVQRGQVKPVVNIQRLEDLPGLASRSGESNGKAVIKFENSSRPYKL